MTAMFARSRIVNAAQRSAGANVQYTEFADVYRSGATAAAHARAELVERVLTLRR